MYSILLVEDHASLREAIAYVFDREPDFTVTAQAGSLAEAREMLEAEPVDIAVVDLELPDGVGTEIIRELRRRNEDGMVLVLTASYDQTLFARAVESGASGVMHKSEPLEDLVAALRRLSAGEALLSANEIVELLRAASRQRSQDHRTQLAIEKLSEREREVLQALADGLGDREIAHKLRISIDTARKHMANILTKFEVGSRLQALVFAVRHGVVEIH